MRVGKLLLAVSYRRILGKWRSLGKDSGNRVLTMLKAILNHAWNDESDAIPTDQAWRKVNGIRARSLSHGFHTSNDPAAALR